jgi:hypothetical protein
LEEDSSFLSNGGTQLSQNVTYYFVGIFLIGTRARQVASIMLPSGDVELLSATVDDAVQRNVISTAAAAAAATKETTPNE